MKATYAILEPMPIRRRRRAQGRGWLTAMVTLAIGLPIAIGISSYMLSSSGDGLTPPTIPAIATAPEIDPGPIADAPTDIAEVPVNVVDEGDEPVEQPKGDPSRRVVRLAWGDTLVGMLMKQAVPESEAHEAMAALRKVYDPRTMQAGKEVTLRYDEKGAFSGFEFEPSAERTVRVERKDGDYKAASVLRPVSNNVMAASIVVDGSLYESGVKAGIPMKVMASLVKTLSYNIDFQRDVHNGDKFRVMYEVFRNPDGEMIRTGDILYASAVVDDKDVAVYRYKFADGHTEYFDGKGQTVRRALLRTPVNAARVSSGYGMRIHPIQGYSKMHKGVDFAAPTGTPIYAAGDGIIIERGWKSGYGNYIRMRHNKELQTAYAHMSRFNGQFTRGSRVRQGEVIGYVGSTGNSTGPHLHFEVMINNVQVNPLSVKNMNAGQALSGRDMTRLKAISASINRQFNSMDHGKAIDIVYNPTSGEAGK